MNQPNEHQIEEIRAELQARGKIAAVKLYKDWTGCSLMEAKTAVEAIEHVEELSPPTRPEKGSVDEDTLRQIDDSIAQGKKLNAIKLYRDASGRSLRESKDFVESRMQHPSTTSRESVVHSERSGCFSVLLLVISAATGCVAAVLACA